MNYFKIFIAHINIFLFFIKAKTDGDFNSNDPAEMLDDDIDDLPGTSEYDLRVDYDNLRGTFFMKRTEMIH